MRPPRQTGHGAPRRHPLLRAAVLVPTGLLLAVIVALLVAPEFIDWNRYRDRIAGAIEEKLGRAVAIDGGLSLSLLPVPQMVAEQVHVANLAGAADKNFASADRLELRLRGLPLLAGRFEVSSLVLAHPRIHIERLPDGRANWRFAPAPDIHVHSAPASDQPQDGIVFLPDSNGGALQRIELRDATISVRLPHVGMATAENVDADATAGGAEGPFQFHVTGHSGDTALALQGTVGRLDANDTPVDIALDIGGGAARVSLGGALTGRDAATALNGRLTVKAAHANRLTGAAGWTTTPEGPVELHGMVAATLHDVAVQNVSLDLPGGSLTGYLAMNLEGDPQLDVKLAAPRLDFAPWAGAKAETPAKGDGKDATSPAAVLTALSTVNFKLPTWLGASIDLSAESIPWHGVLIRGARLDALLANGELTINQVGATFPGNSQINLFGFVDAADGKPSFDGSFETGTDDLRSLLRWLSVDVAGMPEDRLGAARFTGHLAAAPDRIKLDGAEIRVDGTRITTAVDLRLPRADAPRPALGASFAIDTLNADAYLSHIAAAGAPTTGTTTAAAPDIAAKPTLGTLGQWLGSFDANVKGHIGQMAAGGVTFANVDLDGGLTNGTMTLRSLSVGTVADAKASVTGKIADLDAVPRFDGLKLDITADDPHRLLAALDIDAPTESLGPLNLSAQLDGDAANVAVQSQGSVAGLSAKIDGKIATPLATPGFDLNVVATHPNLAGALRLFGLDYRHRAGTQSASAAFHLTGTAQKANFDDLKLGVGDLALAGHAAVGFAGRPHIDAALTAGDVPLDLLLGAPIDSTPAPRPAPPPQPPKAASGDPTAPQPVPRPAVAVGSIADHFSHAPIDFAWMRAADGTVTIDATAFTWGALKLNTPSVALTLADGKATLDRFTGKLWGGDLTVSAALDDSGAVSCGAQLAGAQLKQAVLGVADLNLADGALDLSADLTSTGSSPAELMGRLAGGGKIAARDGTLKGFDLKAANDRLKTPSATSLVTLVQAGANGETKFKTLNGTVKATGGIFTTDDLTLTADGGTLKASGAVNLPAYAMDAHADLHLADAPDAPPLVLRLSGPLSGPRRVLDINPLQTWLAQRGAKGAK